MNAPINDGGPAFPVPDSDSRGYVECSNVGMTLRDYFAGQCVAAMVGTIRDDDYRRYCFLAENHGKQAISDWFASEAYKQADAMLRAREVRA